MELEHLIKLIDAVSESSLESFKYEENGVKLSLKKPEAGKVITVEQMAAPVVERTVEAAVVEQPKKEVEGNVVKSPLVGTFYVAPSEDAEPFVKVGDRVEKGQVLAIVEAMKLMNEIESEFAGEIVEVCVANGEMVEYGQPLFRVR